MQIFYPPESLAVFLCFIIWPVLQTIAAVICKILPDNFFSPYSVFFKSHKWEQNGQIYRKIFRIHQWKKFLPDSGMIIQGSYKKSRFMILQNRV
ncbi:MAG: glycosyl-4,4'-diaponeurosporenoate acyltransferase CrtO family protein [Eubacteriales bacterium]